MDKIPELYISFLGGLKMGAIVQPLFSAFGEDSLLTRLDVVEGRGAAHLPVVGAQHGEGDVTRTREARCGGGRDVVRRARGWRGHPRPQRRVDEGEERSGVLRGARDEPDAVPGQDEVVLHPTTVAARLRAPCRLSRPADLTSTGRRRLIVIAVG